MAPPVNDPTGPPRLCRNDCTYCGDGVVQKSSGESCDDGNSVDGNCQNRPVLDNCRNDCTIPICGDPAKIRFHNPPALDYFTVFGRIIPIDTFDPASMPISFTLTDEQGNVLISESLQAGQLTSRGLGWRFSNTSARTQGGIKSWTVNPHNKGFTFRVQAYGSFRDVTSFMKGTLTVGDTKFTADGKWTQTNTGWVLFLRDAIPH